MPRGYRRHVSRTTVRRHACLVCKPEQVAVVGNQHGAPGFPFDSSFAFLLPGEHRGTCAVTENARAYQDAGVIIEVKSRTADLDAYGENAITAIREQQR